MMEPPKFVAAFTKNSHGRTQSLKDPDCFSDASTVVSKSGSFDECNMKSCSFHDFGRKFNDAKSVEDFKRQLNILIENIWFASYSQKMTPCILNAVSECIDNWKAGQELSEKVVDSSREDDNPLNQFYKFRFGEKSLAASIILHTLSKSGDSGEESLSSSLSKADPETRISTSIRYSLLQMILDEVPMPDTATRDQLYLACATTGSNSFFRQVKLAGARLKEADTDQASLSNSAPNGNTEIKRLVQMRCGFSEDVRVFPLADGFKLEWFVPDFLQRLRSGLSVSTELVAKGMIWGVYIYAPGTGSRWEFRISPLEPSPSISFKRAAEARFTVSRKRKYLPWMNKSVTIPCLKAVELVPCVALETENHSHIGGWSLTQKSSDRCSRNINKDGSCHLTIVVQASKLHGW